MLSHQEYRQMQLAGTVTFPATFPQVGRLELRCVQLPLQDCAHREVLYVAETPSPRVSLTRRVFADAVRAVFLPRDPRCVNYADGEWLLGTDVVRALQQRLATRNPLYGIIFVAENEPSLLSVSAGMTAAESAQYYPPLPGDPSNNHYNPWPGRSTGSYGLQSCKVSEGCEDAFRSCSHLDCDDFSCEEYGAMACASDDDCMMACACDDDCMMACAWDDDCMMACESNDVCMMSCSATDASMQASALEHNYLRAPSELDAFPFPIDDLRRR